MSHPFEVSDHKLLSDAEEEDVCPFSHIFDEFLSPKASFSLNKIPWNPPTDIYETQDLIVIRMELAGVNKEHIDISLLDQILTIQGYRHEETPVKKKNYHLMEIHYGPFQRSFRLPMPIKRNDINANYKDGFLKITIPKRMPASEIIEIESH